MQIIISYIMSSFQNSIGQEGKYSPFFTASNGNPPNCYDIPSKETLGPCFKGTYLEGSHMACVTSGYVSNFSPSFFPLTDDFESESLSNGSGGDDYTNESGKPPINSSITTFRMNEEK